MSGDTKPAVTTVDLVKYNLSEKYLAQVTNFFAGDKAAAMRFMTSAVDYIRRLRDVEKLTPISIVNSLMTIASFRFMPSSVAGEAYIIPYGTEAKFQMGYKGYVTLFYRAGVRKIVGDIIRENDEYSYEDGQLKHKVDLRASREARGKPIGAYVRITLPTGEETVKYMHADDILAHGKKFSKAFSKDDSPWKEANDPELWMWKKTVLLQAAKFVPKNDELVRAMDEDAKDSVLHDRLEQAAKESNSLRMGELLETSPDHEGKEAQEGAGKGAQADAASDAQ